MEAKQAVLEVNQQFYTAFELMDLDRMEAVWACRESDVCVHPGWEILRGWESIRASWQVIFANTGYMRFKATDVVVDINGETAQLSCVENIFSVVEGMTIHSRVACTNLFHLTSAGWRMVLHHGSPIASSHVTQHRADEIEN